MYMQRKTIRLSNIMNIQQVYIDFLHAIEKQTFAFINTYELLINAASATMNYETQLFVVIKKFRHHMRLKKTRKKKHSYLIQFSQSTKTINQIKAIN